MRFVQYYQIVGFMIIADQIPQLLTEKVRETFAQQLTSQLLGLAQDVDKILVKSQGKLKQAIESVAGDTYLEKARNFH